MRKAIGIGLAALFLSAPAAAESQLGVAVNPARGDAEVAQPR